MVVIYGVLEGFFFFQGICKGFSFLVMFYVLEMLCVGRVEVWESCVIYYEMIVEFFVEFLGYFRIMIDWCLGFLFVFFVVWEIWRNYFVCFCCMR